jgi:hypothetical protein
MRRPGEQAPVAWRLAHKDWPLLADALAQAGLPLPPEAARHAPRSGAYPAGPGVAQARLAEAAVALRRWRQEPRDTEALALGVRALTQAWGAVDPPAHRAAVARTLARVVVDAMRFGPADAPVVVARRLQAMAQARAQSPRPAQALRR